MRRTFIVLLMLSIATIGFADLVENSVKQIMIDNVIRASRSTARSCAINIGNQKQLGSDLVQGDPTKFEQEDKDKLVAYSILLTDLKDAADAVVAYDWGTIE